MSGAPDRTDTARSSQSLSGLRAVVTGAAGGIGSAISRQLIAQGASVHGLDRDGDGLERMAQDLGAGTFVAEMVVLADRADVYRVLMYLLDRLDRRCDILVNNAGVSRLRSLTDTDDVLLDWMFAVNFIAAFRVTRTLLPALRASGRGSVVNIASELALVGQPDYSAYCATKGAVLAWSRALALELAGQHIRVNVVFPGPVDTWVLQEEFTTHGNPHAARVAEIATVPLSRLGFPADSAPDCAVVARDSAAFGNRAAWVVDGGHTGP